MTFAFANEPVAVAPVETQYRRIATPLPVPESLPILRDVQRHESQSMHGQMPIVWARAKDFQVWDHWGNCWIDFTSTIFVANAGHSNERVARAVTNAISSEMVHSYNYVTKPRADYLKKLVGMMPPYLEKAYLVSTGTEATEAALRLMRLAGAKAGLGPGVVVFDGSYHGRTLGAALMSGTEESREWIGYDDPNIHRFRFPSADNLGDHTDWTGMFEDELDALRQRGVDPATGICGFLLETYVGWSAEFFPSEYVAALVDFARHHDIIVAFDEVQSGFGRTGRFFGYEHYGVEPDLVCAGKGIANGFPLSAVLGSEALMDLPDTGLLSSTHSANPIACAAGLATLEEFEGRNLVSESERKGVILKDRLLDLQSRFPKRIAAVNAKGLVAAVIFTDPTTGAPDPTAASRVCETAMRRGALFVHTRPRIHQVRTATDHRRSRYSRRDGRLCRRRKRIDRRRSARGMTRIRHVGIVVSDLERSLSFYRDVFGLEITWDRVESGPALDSQLGLQGVEVRTVKMRGELDDTQIELLSFRRPLADEDPGGTLTRRGLTHIALAVPDADQAYGRLESMKYTATAPPEQSADGFAKVFFCTDPDGVFLEVVEVLEAAS